MRILYLVDYMISARRKDFRSYYVWEGRTRIVMWVLSIVYKAVFAEYYRILQKNSTIK